MLRKGLLCFCLAASLGAAMASPVAAQIYPPEDGYDDPAPPPPRGYRLPSRRDIDASYPPDAYGYGDPAAPLPVDPSLRERGAASAPNDRMLEEDSNQTTRAMVEYPTSQAPGTIVIDTTRRRLFVVERGGQAISYGIGVGREGFAWKGLARVGRKAEWPAWIPPADMLRRRPELPERMEGGIENPLGARALYLFQGSTDTLFRIHGTNEPDSIGKAVSSGCIRMLNNDVIDLYRRIPVGTRVVVI